MIRSNFSSRFFFIKVKNVRMWKYVSFDTFFKILLQGRKKEKKIFIRNTERNVSLKIPDLFLSTTFKNCVENTKKEKIYHSRQNGQFLKNLI